MSSNLKIKVARISVAVFLISVLLIIIAPKPQPIITKNGDSPTPSKIPKFYSHTVTLTSKGFEPKDIKIKQGDVIHWVNKSGKLATVNSDNYPTNRLYPVLNLGEFTDGSSVQAKISRLGTLTYHNHLIPSQRGTIIVTE